MFWPYGKVAQRGRDKGTSTGMQALYWNGYGRDINFIQFNSRWEQTKNCIYFKPTAKSSLDGLSTNFGVSKYTKARWLRGSNKKRNSVKYGN